MIKKIYLLRFLLLLGYLTSSSLITGQTTKFNNAGGNALWSNAGNWTNGVPNAAGAKAQMAPAGGGITVDNSFTVAQLLFANAGAGGTVANAFTGNGNITITGNAVNEPIQMNRYQQTANFQVPIIYDSNGAVTNKFRQRQGAQNIIFNDEFEVKDPIIFEADKTNSQINFNSSLKGNGNITFIRGAKPKFGPSYNGSNYEGILKIDGSTGDNSVALVSNVNDNGIFFIFIF